MKHLQQKASLVVLLLCALFSCQIPEQPTDIILTDPPGTTIKIADQSNQPIEGAEVSYRIGFEGGFTSLSRNEPDNGVFVGQIPIPLGDTLTKFEILMRLPEGYCPDVIIDTLQGSCEDETFTYNLDRCPVSVRCGDQLELPTLRFELSVPEKLSQTLCTPLLRNTTGQDLTLSAAMCGPFTEFSWSVDGTARQGTTITVQNGQNYQLCVTYAVDAGFSANVSDSCLATITGDTPTQDDCVIGEFMLRREVRIMTPCDCPAGQTFTYPQPPHFDTVCLGSTREVTIPLTSVINNNTSAGCRLEFRLQTEVFEPGMSIATGFAAPSDKMLNPGEALSSITLNFTPTTLGQVDQKVTYAVFKRRPEGDVERCEDLVINYRALAVEARCIIDSQNSTLFLQTPSRPLAFDSLFQGVGLDDPTQIKTICFRNELNCEYTVTDAIIRGTEAGVFEVVDRLPITVPAKGRACIGVKFVPTVNDVYPNGRTNEPKTAFRADIDIRTNPDDCNATFPLYGRVIPRHCIDQTLIQHGLGSNIQGIELLDSGTYEIKAKNSADPNQLDIYCQSISGTPEVAQISAGTGGGVEFSPNPVGTRAIDTQTDDICNYWPDYTQFCGQTGATTISVREGEVFMFTFQRNGQEYCGYMWVKNIDRSTGSGSGTGPLAVTLRFAYPI